LQRDSLNSFLSKALSWKKSKNQNAVAKTTETARTERANVVVAVAAEK
jgi:hypothetical protein